MGGTRGLILAFLCFVITSNWSLSADAAVHNYTFVLDEETRFFKLCDNKTMLTVNGSFPGPEIHVETGDTAYVTVKNNGEYGVTIHWHGVKQPRNPWYDGPENITQCPIQANSSFTYKIIFSDEVGTLWWHAHSDWSRATVHGAIIIKPRYGKPYPYPIQPVAEQVIVIGTWFKGDVMEIIETATASGGMPAESDAYTINGRPGDTYSEYCETDDPRTFNMSVNAGQTYLLRIINAAMNEEMFFGIASHNLTVVGMDAAYVEPLNVEFIMITPGQTMDVLLTANQSPDYYYMAATPYADTMALIDKSNTTGIVMYNGSTNSSQTPAYPTQLPLYNNTDAAEDFMASLKSIETTGRKIDVPQEVSTILETTISMNQLLCSSCSSGSRLAAAMNNVSFQVPSIDILKAYHENISNVFTEDFPTAPPRYFNFTGEVGNYTTYPENGTRVWVIDYNATVEIVFQNTNLGAENHPMHIHGYSFYIVGFGKGNYNRSGAVYNLKNPPLVNTFGVPKNGWLAVRFTANNPGVWFIHCHLERHATWGMDTVLIVKEGSTKKSRLRSQPGYMPPCAAPTS